MSDFDEEAERERLRERFEREEQKREATERMSELLLKGATMTNAHCSDCGDPVFRYDGQEFCATCQRPVDRGDGDDETEGAVEEGGEDAERGDEDVDIADDDGDAADEDATANVEVASPSEDARVRFGGADESDVEEQAETPTEDADVSTARDVPESTSEPSTPEPDRTPTASTPSADDATAIASARADLAATLQRFARAARESENPSVATEHLEAARAAAETLDELD